MFRRAWGPSASRHLHHEGAFRKLRAEAALVHLGDEGAFEFVALVEEGHAEGMADIAEDGEVLIRGPIVMRGYWQNDAANAEVFDADRWFKTGDLGKLDEDGFLFIVGRKKELIVTAGGKNVAPAVLEDRLRSHPLVSQCVVVGDARPFIGALITIDQDSLKPWIAANKKEGASMADLAVDPQLISVIQTAVDEANKAVSKAESIRKFRILTTDFTIAGGQLTAKLSVKRHVIAQEFASEIEALYEKE